MKTLKFIGMASLAVVLCVDFTACSKDNDDLKRTKTILVKTAGTLSTLIPAEEIEQITGLTAVNIRVLLTRARKTLREQIRILYGKR